MITIRPEQATDYAGIYDMTQAAFQGRPYADGDEQDLINQLRKIGALSLSLVAIDNHQLVGQVTFSPATLSTGHGLWFALGPVAVTPERQSQGIGARLIEAGIEDISTRGAHGCILTGNPQHYRRFGFQLSASTCPPEENPEYFMLKLLQGTTPDGRFKFHPAFYENK